MNWPKLSEQLRFEPHPLYCKACGAGPASGVPKLTRWIEHDEQDQPTNVIVVLCPRCARNLIEKHERLYHQVPEHKPIPGTIPELCAACRHRRGLTCTHPNLKANGGSGLNITFPTPSRGFWDGTNAAGRRTGGLFESYPGPPTACAGYAAGLVDDGRTVKP